MSGKLALVVLALCLAVTAARGQETESARLRLMQLSYVSEGSAAADIQVDESVMFEGIGFPPDASGRIVLDGTLAHLSCERVAAVPAGDHTIFIGRVVAGAAAEHGRPLLYYRGGYADPESV